MVNLVGEARTCLPSWPHCSGPGIQIWPSYRLNCLRGVHCSTRGPGRSLNNLYGTLRWSDSKSETIPGHRNRINSTWASHLRRRSENWQTETNLNRNGTQPVQPLGLAIVDCREMMEHGQYHNNRNGRWSGRGQLVGGAWLASSAEPHPQFNLQV